jgi:hypothetical protein
VANFSAPRNPLYAMPRDTAEFHSFIDGQITATGDLGMDYRDALVVATNAGFTTANAKGYSINDAFKLWWEAGKPYL